MPACPHPALNIAHPRDPSAQVACFPEAHVAALPILNKSKILSGGLDIYPGVALDIAKLTEGECDACGGPRRTACSCEADPDVASPSGAADPVADAAAAAGPTSPPETITAGGGGGGGAQGVAGALGPGVVSAGMAAAGQWALAKHQELQQGSSGAAGAAAASGRGLTTSSSAAATGAGAPRHSQPKGVHASLLRGCCFAPGPGSARGEDDGLLVEGPAAKRARMATVPEAAASHGAATAAASAGPASAQAAAAAVRAAAKASVGPTDSWPYGAHQMFLLAMAPAGDPFLQWLYDRWGSSLLQLLCSA